MAVNDGLWRRFCGTRARRGNDREAQAGHDEAADIERSSPSKRTSARNRPPRTGHRSASQRGGRARPMKGSPAASASRTRAAPRAGARGARPAAAARARAAGSAPPRQGTGGCRSRVRVPAVQSHEVQLVTDHDELEADAGVPGAEAADQVGYEPGAERLLERQHHGAGTGDGELADGGDPVVEVVEQRVQVRLEHRPACVMRSVRPERRSSGVPISASRRARARDTPDCVTPTRSLTSVTVVPSATCWNQRSASVSISMTIDHGFLLYNHWSMSRTEAD